MPPLASVSIPAITRAEPIVQIPSKKGKLPLDQEPKLRTYSEDPLPTQLSNQAPKNARIVGRVLDEHGVTYQLKIGEVELNDVGVEEILDYVSALDLESYEHQQFEEEREVRRVIEAEAEAHRLAKIERRKERAKTKGTVLFRDSSVTNDETEGGDETSGGRGRARPTYTHLFKKAHIRKRRKRDPRTGELMSPSDESEEEQASEDEPDVSSSLPPPALKVDELPKRRRRKRDKITGELLPLSPTTHTPATIVGFDKKKRPRRRRHPQTGELMPLGWRYDEGEADHASKDRRDLTFRKLSISNERDPKRQRIGIESSMSRSPSPPRTKAQLASQSSPRYQQTPASASKPATSKTAVLDLVSTDTESDTLQVTTPMARLKPLPKLPGSRLTSSRMLQPTAAASESEDSPEPEPGPKTSILRPHITTATTSSASDSMLIQQPRTGKTSILNPFAAKLSDSSEDDLEDDEYFIEAILAHQMSDPKSHPAELGTEPVMLYQVKWEGSEQLTWEPVESFGDQSIVEEYRRRIGLEVEPSEHDEDTVMTAAPSVSTLSRTAPTSDEDDDNDEDEEEYEVERILGHHLSDPRTHPPGLGKKPVMLYKIRWKGYSETSWEPESSFADQDVLLREYRRRVGLDRSGAGDVVMAE